MVLFLRSVCFEIPSYKTKKGTTCRIETIRHIYYFACETFGTKLPRPADTSSNMEIQCPGDVSGNSTAAGGEVFVLGGDGNLGNLLWMFLGWRILYAIFQSVERSSLRVARVHWKNRE